MQADPLFDAEVREPLFPDEFEEEVPQTDWGVALRLRRIKMMQDQIESIKRQQAAAELWYANRLAKIEERIYREEGELKNYLAYVEKSSVATPEGTVVLTNRTKIAWPEDDVLLAWAQEQPNPSHLIRTKLTPDKATMKTYIKNSGKKPEGYAEVPTSAISIRKATT